MKLSKSYSRISLSEIASILQLDEHLNREFEVFNEEDAENRTVPTSQCVRYSLYGCLLNEI